MAETRIPEKLSEDMLSVLTVIREKGGTDCTGTRHHREAGEFHCHTFARMLNLSSQGVKNRILILLRMGLLQRKRVSRKDRTPLMRFVISHEGEDAIVLHRKSNSMETRDAL